MSECNHDCANCSQNNCNDRQATSKKPLDSTRIKHIIGVLIGKGGVGKSMISSLLAIDLSKRGFSVGILDADITGPSIPKMFDIDAMAYGDDKGIYPNTSKKYGIKIVSAAMLLESEDTPVLWRGPIVSGMVEQFYNQVYWLDLDYLIVDMPPGTSDVALTVGQSLPLDGIVMVTSPSKLVSSVVSKAIVMADKMNTKILSLVENMAFVKCPNCNEKIYLYKNDVSLELAKKYNLKLMAALPLDPALANMADEGAIEDYSEDYLNQLVADLLALD